MKKQDKLSHYWICDSCAKEKGGAIPPGACNTSCMGLCQYCGEKEGFLTPIVDYKWPGGPDPVWD
jgi:hypothetical protein